MASGNRPIAILDRLWRGKDPRRPTYHVSSSLFLRLLGVIYLIAFVSLWTQIDGLVGEHGIVPAGDYLDRVQQYFANQDPAKSPGWNVPTLAWINAGDGFLNFLCAAGTVLSVLLILGLFPLPTLVLLWLSYLSLFHVGQVFLSFQWDILLLETGFLAIFLAPMLRLPLKFSTNRHPPRLAIWLIWWLLFRLMFESGMVKLTWNNWPLGPDGSPIPNTWESLTAMDFHYWTQPLPIWTSWYAAKLPVAFQKLSVVCVLIIEIGLPLLIFGPRLLRYIACSGFTLLMLLIAGTGNYNFFNPLAMLLTLTLLDDSVWPQFMKRGTTGDDSRKPRRVWPTRIRSVAVLPLFVLALLLGIAQLKTACDPPERPRASLASKMNIAQFFLVNDYGLFRRMTETRPEIVIEGSGDGTSWKPYGFRWKPGDLAQRPRLAAPHQPRLDWQMWFEALRLEQVHEVTGTIDPRHMSPWFQAFLNRLLEQQPEVLKLLGENPFPDRPPAFIRIVLYQYRFTSTQEASRTGNWWHRDLVWLGPGWSLAQ